MRIGITGHQRRSDIDWEWVASSLQTCVSCVPNATEALTSLAAGADQVFARVALSLGLTVVAVLPLPAYERFFDKEDRASYLQLLDRCVVVQLPGAGSDAASFMAAGRFVVDRCDLLLAVWDGRPAHGIGGTADVIDYALKIGRPVDHIDTHRRIITRLVGSSSTPSA